MINEAQRTLVRNINRDIERLKAFGPLPEIIAQALGPYEKAVNAHLLDEGNTHAVTMRLADASLAVAEACTVAFSDIMVVSR